MIKCSYKIIIQNVQRWFNYIVFCTNSVNNSTLRYNGKEKEKKRFTKANKRNRCTYTDSLETTCLIRSKYA